MPGISQSPSAAAPPQPRRFPDAAQIDGCLLEHRHGLRKRVQMLRQRLRQQQPIDEGLQRLWQEVEASRTVVAQRLALQRPIVFPEHLPFCERLDALRQAISEHQVVVLCGATGSGKSTQLPKLCLELGRGLFGRIGHTQPRRIAARTLAQRIATELAATQDGLVGSKVRFHDRVKPQTRIKLMTDGILLAEIQQDRRLQAYDTLILDEAHERSLNIDFLLGYLHQLLPRRPDLKLIITSATIDPERFSRHFHQAPIFEVSGRTYPVEVRYRPPAEAGVGERDESLQQALLEAVDELSREDRGDILVFLSGEREIRETAESLRKHALPATEVLPLYARQGPEEQARIFSSHASRRILLATNVAETSLTVPGIRHVIDAGFARISRYSHRSKLQRLPVERISQASAEQRKGRCGRQAPGICIRLYDLDDFQARAPFTEPEIQRTNLAAVILQMKHLGFGRIEDFPFLDPPDGRMIADGYRLLEWLEALDRQGQITPLGRQLAHLPVDPRIGRMLIAAAQTHCLRELTVIGAVLNVQDPRERPLDKQQAADEMHATFFHEQSDFLGFLNLWRFLEEQHRHLSQRKFRELCKLHFLSWNRVQEWRDIHGQVHEMMAQLGFRENQADADHPTLHRAILTGLLDQIGCKDENREYQGVRNQKFFIHPGSGLFASAPKWIVAAERVETTKVYARIVASVQPDWIETSGRHLLQWTYSEAHWQSQAGQVTAYARGTLLGLMVIARRRVNYGPINPRESREIFIRSALVEQDFHTRAPFFRHNHELREYVESLEHKTRRRDILVDHESIFAYYDARIPQDIYNTPAFETWLRQVSRQQPKLLHMDMADLMNPLAAAVVQTDFPDHLEVQGSALPLDYHFDPGSERDGVNLVVPLALLNQISADRCTWPIPGLLRERVEAELRGLPKHSRKQLVPIPDTAARVAAVLQPGDRPFLRALAETLRGLTGVCIPESEWRSDEVPDYLRIGIRIVDADGRVLGEGKEVAQLQRQLAEQAGQRFSGKVQGQWERDDLRDWDFDELPESLTVRQGGVEHRAFPALVDGHTRVALRLLDSAERAAAATRAGMRRLFMLRLAGEVRYLRKNLPDLNRLRLQYAAAPARESIPGGDLEEDLVALIVDQTFGYAEDPPRARQAFHDRLTARKSRLMVEANQLCALLTGILAQYHDILQSLATLTQTLWRPSVDDLRQQLDGLVYRGFLVDTPVARLRDYPRYLQGMQLRIERLPQAAAKDRQRLLEFRELLITWHNRQLQAAREGRSDERLTEIRWLFEELRISLFAQPLKTSGPVSLQRIQQRWRELGL